MTDDRDYVRLRADEERREAQIVDLKKEIAESEDQERLHEGAGNKAGRDAVRKALRCMRNKLYRLEHENG